MENIKIHLNAGIFKYETVQTFMTAIQSALELVTEDFKLLYIKTYGDDALDNIEKRFFDYTVSLVKDRQYIVSRYAKKISASIKEKTFDFLIRTYIEIISEEMKLTKVNCNAPDLKDFVYAVLVIFFKDMSTHPNNNYIITNQFEKIAAIQSAIRMALLKLIYEKMEET